MTHEYSHNGKIWKIPRLIKLAEDLPLQTILVSELFGKVKHKYPWNGLSFEDIIFHMRRVLEVDLLYPIILSADGRIMDGYHRLARAILEKRTVIYAKQFLVDPQPDVIEDRLWPEELDEDWEKSDE